MMLSAAQSGSGYRHPVPWETAFPPTSMVDLFEAAAATHGDAPLIDFMGRRYGYAETRGAADRVACGLARLGYGPGDRIGIFLPNVPHYYGVLKLGATVVNFSPLYTVDELAHQVADSGTRLLFTVSAKALLPTAMKVLDRSDLERLVVGSVAGALPLAKSWAYRMTRRKDTVPRPDDPRVIAFSALIANDGACAAPAIDPVRDVALIQYTGGTTGAPKGAMLTHANLAANARQVAALDPDLGPDLGRGVDRILGVLPLFHVFANTCVLNRTVVAGGEIVMLPRFDAGQTLAALARTGATSLPGVPTMFQALLDHPAIGTTDFRTLRTCISGGAPLAAELADRFRAATGVTLVEGYGLSETSGVVSCNPYRAPGIAGSIGQPLAGTEVALVDKEDPSRPAPAGEPGEMVLRGPQIMLGYWNQPEADADIFVDDAQGRRWMRTGDVGTIDADGFVTIVDRLKDMIAVSGFKVFPSQLEAHLYRHPAIREALVIGMPDPYRGESPHAFVTLHEGAETTGEELARWLNMHVGRHEKVSRVVVRGHLPKTMIGKLSRKDLLAELKAEVA